MARELKVIIAELIERIIPELNSCGINRDVDNNGMDTTKKNEEFTMAKTEMRWDFFYRHENNRVNPKELPAQYVTMYLPENVTHASDAMAIAIEEGLLLKGSHRTGCFEIQNDLGIWSHVDGNRMDFSTPRKAAKVTFKTWEQLEAEDEQDEHIEIVIDGNCGSAAVETSPKERLALSDQEKGILEAIKEGRSVAWNFYDKIVVTFSGGKDSLACLLHILDLGCPKEKIELWHHDIDGGHDADRFMDWGVTADYCRKVAEEFGIPIRFSWKEKGFLGEVMKEEERSAPSTFEMLDGTTKTCGGNGKVATRRKFPAVSADLQARWCSGLLKIDVGCFIFTNDPAFTKGRFMIITGERREESKKRSTYAEAEWHKTKSQKRTVIQWRPVIDWTEAQVWDIISEYKVAPHPCYKAGFGRCSCALCIFGNCDQFATAKDLAPMQFEKLAEVEDEIGFTLKKDKPIREFTAKGQSFAADTPEEIRTACSSRTYDLPVIDQDWVLPTGAFKKDGGPV